MRKRLLILVLALGACPAPYKKNPGIPGGGDDGSVDEPDMAQPVDTAMMMNLDMALPAADKPNTPPADSALSPDKSSGTGGSAGTPDAMASVDMAPISKTDSGGGVSTITNLMVQDAPFKASWSVEPDLKTGDTPYGDRTYTFNLVSAALAGQPYIRPAADSKAYAATPLVTFDIAAPAIVYAGFDTRNPAPAWAAGWTTTAEQVTYVDQEARTVVHKMVSKSFPAGTVSLGPSGCPQHCNMYMIVVKF